MWAGGLGLVALLALTASTSLLAQGGTVIGYVDVERVIEEYLFPALNEPFEREVARLQAEFDEASADLADEEKLALFRQYEERLEEYRQALVDGETPRIHAAVAAAAEEHGVAVVLARPAVLHGGVDLTDTVLAHLYGQREAPAAP
ncbi:MAG: hypothetical protein LOD84_05635 [Limnochordales bacterium]